MIDGSTVCECVQSCSPFQKQPPGAVSLGFFVFVFFKQPQGKTLTDSTALCTHPRGTVRLPERWEDLCGAVQHLAVTMETAAGQQSDVNSNRARKQDKNPTDGLSCVHGGSV